MRDRRTFAGAKVLITGGLGFIGSTLARRLVDEAAEVVLVDSLIPEYGGNLANIWDIESRVRINYSDVRDPFSMRALIRGHDFLFNLAGQTSHLDSMRDPFTDLEINTRAQLSILEACRQENPRIGIVFASTRQIYGRPGYLPVDEDHPIRPVDVNGINKCAGEAFHLLYGEVYGMTTCSLRLTNTYGPRMRVCDARQTFVGLWIRRLVEGCPFEVWGGSQLRDFTYVDDAVEALMLAAVSPGCTGQALNLGGCPPISLAALADLLVRLNGGGSYQVVPYPEEGRRIDVGSFYSDDRRFRSLTGWEPRVELESGLQRTLDYYRRELRSYLPGENRA